MNRIITSLAILLLSAPLIGQTSGGPDQYGYRWKTSLDPTNPPSFDWIDISKPANLITGLADDNYVGPFTGSNNFQYYWYNTPQFYIGSNGFISFNGVNIASPFPSSIPNALGGNDFIAPYLGDLNFAGSGNPAKCYVYASNDTLVVTFEEVPFWAPGVNYTGSNTFQIYMNKTDLSITFNYLSMNGGTYSTTDNIVGIENVSGTIGLNCYTDTLLGDSLTIQFTYPSTVTYQARDAGMNWSNNPEDGGIFIIAGSSGLPSQASIKNFGNVALSNIMVYDTLYGSNGTAYSGGSASVSSLATSQEAVVNFSDTIAAPTAGRYTLHTRTIVTGDVVGANNFNFLEVNAVDSTGNQMALEYTDGTADGGGLGWNGGNGGIGVYIEPPFYPAKVKDMRYYLTSLGSPAQGFHAILYDDDGANGGPGTTLDSVWVGPGSLNANNYKYVNTTKEVIIDSGGVYLLWLMGGNGINLGRDLTPPFSRRTYEILGGSWSGYRDRLTEDFLMGIRVIYPFPNARFIYDALNDPTIQFTDKSTNKPTSWLWDFGDGTTDTNQNTIHTYAMNDTVEVCLTATNKYGSDTYCDDIVIDGNVPTADYTYSTTSSPTIIFTDLSINDPTSWHWDFGVGPGDTSNNQNAAFKFNGNGVYNVCLTASNKNGPSTPYCEDITIGGLGIGELDGASIDLFPNPMTDVSTVRLSKELASQNVRVRLYNMLGETVDARIQRKGNDFNIFRSGLQSGMYIIEIQLEDQVLSRLTLQIR